MATDRRTDLNRPRRIGPWIILALALLILLGWWLWPTIWPAEDEEVGDAVVAVPEPDLEAEIDPVVTTEVLSVGLQASVGDILESPDAFLGESVPLSDVDVAEVPTDRGFWIENPNDGARLFAILVDVPEEEPKDLNPGQTLQVEGGTLQGPPFLPEMPGNPLDPETRSIAESQPIFLVVDERYIEIVAEAP